MQICSKKKKQINYKASSIFLPTHIIRLAEIVLANKTELFCPNTPQMQIIHNCVHANCKAAGCRAGRQLRTCDVIENRALGEADSESVLDDPVLVLATRLPICSTGKK